MSPENEYKNLALELNSVCRLRKMGNAEILHRLMVFSEELEDKQKDAVQIVIDAFFSMRQLMKAKRFLNGLKYT
jgi:hypothetical protein